MEESNKYDAGYDIDNIELKYDFVRIEDNVVVVPNESERDYWEGFEGEKMNSYRFKIADLNEEYDFDGPYSSFRRGTDFAVALRIKNIPCYNCYDVTSNDILFSSRTNLKAPFNRGVRSIENGVLEFKQFKYKKYRRWWNGLEDVAEDIWNKLIGLAERNDNGIITLESILMNYSPAILTGLGEQCLCEKCIIELPRYIVVLYNSKFKAQKVFLEKKRERRERISERVKVIEGMMSCFRKNTENVYAADISHLFNGVTTLNEIREIVTDTYNLSEEEMWLLKCVLEAQLLSSEKNKWHIIKKGMLDKQNDYFDWEIQNSLERKGLIVVERTTSKKIIRYVSLVDVSLFGIQEKGDPRHISDIMGGFRFDDGIQEFGEDESPFNKT